MQKPQECLPYFNIIDLRKLPTWPLHDLWEKIHSIWGFISLHIKSLANNLEERDVWWLALTGPTGQPSTRLKPLSFLLSSVSWKTDYFFVWIFPPWDLEKLQHTRVNILDLKILLVFFKNRGENFSFLKNVEFLEFFGFTLCFRTFPAKKIFQNFSDW